MGCHFRSPGDLLLFAFLIWKSLQHFLHEHLTLTAFSGDRRSRGFEPVDSTEVDGSLWPSPREWSPRGCPLGLVSVLPSGVGKRAAAHSPSTWSPGHAAPSRRPSNGWGHPGGLSGRLTHGESKQQAVCLQTQDSSPACGGCAGYRPGLGAGREQALPTAK